MLKKRIKYAIFFIYLFLITQSILYLFWLSLSWLIKKCFNLLICDKLCLLKTRCINISLSLWYVLFLWKCYLSWWIQWGRCEAMVGAVVTLHQSLLQGSCNKNNGSVSDCWWGFLRGSVGNCPCCQVFPTFQTFKKNPLVLSK